jgi:hypothetical protein
MILDRSLRIQRQEYTLSSQAQSQLDEVKENNVLNSSSSSTK